MKEITIPSLRQTPIPVSIYEAEKGTGLLLLIHSFRSDRKEDGRFEFLGRYGQEHGCHVLALDFPGSADSKEGMIAYTLGNCVADLEEVYRYMLENYQVDKRKLALLGYSLGGRIMSLFYQRHPEFQNLIFWAAYNDKLTLADHFLGQQLSDLKKMVMNGSFLFHDIYQGDDILMSGAFLDDLLDRDCLEPLHNFQGNALIIQGNNDQTIPAKSAQLIYDTLAQADERRLVIIEGADHGFGLWDGRSQDEKMLLEESVCFLDAHLR